MQVNVAGVALWGPGLPGWEASRATLSGLSPVTEQREPLPVPALLGPAERRRTSPVVRLALHLAERASLAAGIPCGAISAVFATSNGEGALLGALLEVLARDNTPISPTQFHNSVHNAAAGYWTIATRSRAPFTCLACHDASAAAALLQSAAQIVTGGESVLCVCYDLPLSAPLDAKRPVLEPFGFALVLAPPGSSQPRALRVRYAPEPAEEAMWLPQSLALQPLARGNPAARGLRILELLAGGNAGRARLPMLDGSVDVEVTPCSTAPRS